MKYFTTFVAISACVLLGTVSAQAACTVTNSFTSGSPAIAADVNTNFSDVLACINGGTFGAPLTIGSGASGTNSDLIINGGNTSSNGVQIAIQQGGTSRGWLGNAGRIYGSSSADLALVAASGNAIQFAANGASPQMTLSTAGVLFVGGSSTWFGSGGRIYGVGGANTYPVSAYNSGAGGAAFLGRVDNTSTSLAAFYYSSGAVGSITTNGSTTAYNTTSDERLKSNIRTLSPDLSAKALAAYAPSEFLLRGKPGVGPIAQRLYRNMRAAGIDPVAVGIVTPGDNDAQKREGQPGFRQWQVDSAKMMPYAISVILEQQKQINQLQGQVTALTASVKKMTEVRFAPTQRSEQYNRSEGTVAHIKATLN